MYRKIITWSCFLSFFTQWGTLNAAGAFIYTEAFSTGMNGWSNTGSMAVSSENAALCGQFGAQTFPFPETGAFFASNAASGGAFVGDYPAAGGQLIGFSFMVQDVLPSALLVRISGPTASFFRNIALDVAQTGVWHRLIISLRSRDAGQWIGGTAQEFEETVRDVQSLEIQITRGDMSSQCYWIDDVFLDALPVGTEVFGDGTVIWAHLRTDVAYIVEAAEESCQEWVAVGGFTAGSTVQSWLDPTATNTSRKVYRLLLLDHQP